MPALRNRFVGLCLPPLLFCAIDGTFTLWGQLEAYWAGHYDAVQERSPTFHQLLIWNPAAGIAGILVWAAVFVAVILLLPDTLALIVSLAATIGHVMGSATWALYSLEHGYQACNGMFLLAAIVLGLGIRHGWQATPPTPSPCAHWHPALRWSLIVGLVAVGLYLFLIPRSP